MSIDTKPYNDYVLSTCLQAGWITDEQQQLVIEQLKGLPGASALTYLFEQQLISQNKYNVLLGKIQDAVQQQFESEKAAHAASSTSVSVKTTYTEIPSLQDFLKLAIQAEASDVHLGPFSPAIMRIHGQLVPMMPNAPILSPEQTMDLAKQFLLPDQVKTVEDIGGVDFCYDDPGLARFRASVVRQRRGWESVFRVISSRIRTMEEIGLPPVLYRLLKYHNGLILVTGSVGCGKTTTLAAMVNQINRERKDHIISLEDPIEYVFKPEGCQVTQREIHSHTMSFSSALRASLRQDPDVIMVGEMRDLETISLAITASETGHLVLATLHTSNAARTMQRLLDVFPVEQQSQIRTMVSESLRGVVCQQLIPRADGRGRVLALEIMTNNPAIGNLIREGKNFMLPGQIQIGKKDGMRLMDDSLIELVRAGTITQEEAFQRSENKQQFAQWLAGGN
ncbi:MAG: type IV pilus twitching motility protein PilT [Blastochloris sp.]|nr:type IV pilus twitching motility protein PilT [Blastochloris sp.]